MRAVATFESGLRELLTCLVLAAMAEYVLFLCLNGAIALHPEDSPFDPNMWALMLIQLFHVFGITLDKALGYASPAGKDDVLAMLRQFALNVPFTAVVIGARRWLRARRARLRSVDVTA